MKPVSKYWEKYQELKSVRAVARFYGVHPSTVARSVQRYQARLDRLEELPEGVKQGMQELQLSDGMPSLVWVKSQRPDANGRTYSVLMKGAQEDAEDDTAERIAALFTGTSPVAFHPPQRPSSGDKRAFISINDLHAGALAWGKETGYGDWDLDIAVERLRRWLSRLLALVQTEGVSEIILYYNGDTLHANGSVPMTSTQGTNHVLDVDTRQFKTVDITTEAIISMTDMAAQVADVRLVIKPGNHDGDAYIALLQGAKWRYRDQSNVFVDMDPSPYWAHIFGRVALFGHHGDKVKVETMVMRFLEQYRKEIADVEHVIVWTGHQHTKSMQQFPGVTWEQATCWTKPDAFGSHFGDKSMAQAVIYCAEEGEVARFTVRDLRRHTEASPR